MAPAQDSTLRLVDLSRAGDEAAFHQLVTRNGGRLLLHIRSKAGRALTADCDAEDLCQVALATAWRLLPGFEHRGAGTFYRWLSTIATNTINDRLRYLDAKGRDGVRHMESGDLSSGGGVRGPIDPNKTAGSIVALREWVARIEAAVGALDVDIGAVVRLRLFEGLSFQDIASALGISKATAHERWARGLDLLRGLLGPLD